jgi:hypothetical protein
MMKNTIHLNDKIARHIKRSQIINGIIQASAFYLRTKEPALSGDSLNFIDSHNSANALSILYNDVLPRRNFNPTGYLATFEYRKFREFFSFSIYFDGKDSHVAIPIERDHLEHSETLAKICQISYPPTASAS